MQTHLEATALIAETACQNFAVGWGNLAGLWHDAGKYRKAFQERIGAGDAQSQGNEPVDHKHVGALLAMERKLPPLALVIAGHHGGLANKQDLEAKLEQCRDLLDDAIRCGLPEALRSETTPVYPAWLRTREAVSFWVRMLFSALVDADFLDTERFYEKGLDRTVPRPKISELRKRIDTYIDLKACSVESSRVNEMRSRVLTACRSAAERSPGMFTLTVPTGGGKTLSAMSFALAHAEQHGKERVIVVIPYTSIIEQTAKVYHDALGEIAEAAIVEHHTNVDADRETVANRLASENWDAPIVVTTSVQFFESLFANKPSRCRKLHNIANSVVIFDEVQTFEPGLLSAIKHSLRELTAHYGVSAVLCTATQPVLFDHSEEIVSHPEQEFAAVSDRYAVLMPNSTKPFEWVELAQELQGHQQVLAIVHRRRDAQELAQLSGEDCLHLSGKMCAKHRAERLMEIRRRLQNGERCRVVATQLVEAGVDVDFPEVYRAFAGADSMAQAAGRCNREGRSHGRLHIFIAPSSPPRGVLETGFKTTLAMWQGGRFDLKSASTFTEYFRRLYLYSDLDKRQIMALERELRFRDTAQEFRMIEDQGESVVAPYGAWAVLVDDIRRNGISRLRMRRLQRYIVKLYRDEVNRLFRERAIEKIEDAFWTVNPGFEHKVYDVRWGFGWQGMSGAEPDQLIA